MKKYRIVIILVILFYIGIAVFGNGMIYKLKQNSLSGSEESLHLVEINRLYAKCVQNSEFLNHMDEIWEYVLSEKQYNYICRLEFLPAYVIDAQKTDEIQEFYKHRNGYYSVIKPVMNQEEIKGYLRFDYILKEVGNEEYILFNLGLLVLLVVQVIILIYVYHKIIRPFHMLSDIPFELSKGNLRHDVKEEKSRYFGKFIWGVGMLKDALEVHRQRELKLAKEKKMILLSISHDIKTPLNAIDLYAKALECGMYQTKEEQKAAVVKIRQKAKEIDGFVKDIVKSSTEDIIAIEVINKDYYLKEIVEKIKNGYSEKCKLRHTNLTIEPYNNYLLYGDLDRVYEAVGNLMENAFKYGDGIEITIKFAEEENYLLMTVYNSGTPVEDNEMAHLFDSFYRGANTEGKSGNGLGLYICREIMLKMSGDIYADREKMGMSFTLVNKISS